MKLSRIFSFLLALLLAAALAPVGFADETTETTTETEAPATKETSGTCGDNLIWELNGSTLTISGSGEMAEGAPWRGHKENIETVILEGGITTVAAEAFSGYKNLSAVDFGGSLREIGKDAFRECLGLKEISLPESFRILGPGCFYGCTELAEIYCYGGMPSFKDSCLWNIPHVMIYFPANNPWPAESVQILADNFGGRLEIVPVSMDTPRPQVVKPAETEPAQTELAETEPETVPTTEAALPPETLSVYAAVTVPAAVPETTEAEETTQSVVYTLPTMAAEPQEEPEERGISGGIVAICLIVGVLTFFIGGALIARSVRNKRCYQ